MNDGRERITAIIPAYQEGPRIAAVVEAVARHLPVVVVDDGSTDDTAERAESAGFRDAQAAGSIAVVTLDADGQHDPAEIPAFIAVFRDRRPGLIVGRRDFSKMPPARRASNVLGGVAVSVALGRDVPDNQSGYRLIGRELMNAMLPSEESGFEFEVEMIARCIALGLPIDWVPIRTIYGGEPSHIQPWRHFREFLRVTRKARRIARGENG